MFQEEEVGDLMNDELEDPSFSGRLEYLRYFVEGSEKTYLRDR